MIASLKYFDDAYVFSAWTDLAVIQNGTLVTVWNLVLDSTVTWDALLEYPYVRSFSLARSKSLMLNPCTGTHFRGSDHPI